MAAHATLEQVAQACDITVRRVNQLAKEGVLPREGRGAYNLGKCMAAYIRYLHKAMQSRSTVDGDGEMRSLQAERTTLIKTQREREQFELAKSMGQVIELQAHEKILADLVVETKASVMAVAPRSAPELVGLDSRVMAQAIVEKHLKEALSRLAKLVPRREIPEKPIEKEPTKKEPARSKSAKKRG